MGFLVAVHVAAYCGMLRHAGLLKQGAAHRYELSSLFIDGSLWCMAQIVRDKDADGFYVGELGGRRGLVPSNMVSPVDDATAAAGRAASGVNSVAGGRLTDGGDPVRAGKPVSPPSPRRHHRQNGWVSHYILARTVTWLELGTRSDQLSLLPFVGREMGTGQSVVMLCGWEYGQDERVKDNPVQKLLCGHTETQTWADCSAWSGPLNDIANEKQLNQWLSVKRWRTVVDPRDMRWKVKRDCDGRLYGCSEESCDGDVGRRRRRLTQVFPTSHGRRLQLRRTPVAQRSTSRGGVFGFHRRLSVFSARYLKNRCS